MAAGIDIRHARSCQSRARGRCTCKPTFQAHVFDSRTGKRIRKTVPDEERRPAVAAGRDVHRGAAVVDEHVATDAEIAAVVGVKGRDQPEAGVYLAAGELGEARAHRVGVVGRQCVQPGDEAPGAADPRDDVGGLRSTGVDHGRMLARRHGEIVPEPADIASSSAGVRADGCARDAGAA
jgi:hypothetical protein